MSVFISAFCYQLIKSLNYAANNPTLDAMTEIHEYNMALLSVNRKSEAVPISSVVSLGTGLIPVTELKEIDVFRPDSIWDTAKLAYGISAIGNLLVDQATVSRHALR